MYRILIERQFIYLMQYSRCRHIYINMGKDIVSSIYRLSITNHDVSSCYTGINEFQRNETN